MIRELLRIFKVLGSQTSRFFRDLGWARFCGAVAAFVVILVVCFMLFTAGWDRPPIKSVQTGYRGSGQVVVYNPREVSRQFKGTQFADAPPAASDGGPRASEVFENIKVLGDLSVGQFIRQMQGMTDAVAPDQGCSYCHANGNFASDELYTKRVARRMLQMTRSINTKWSSHVGQDVGVTCFTCHRGNHVPSSVWANQLKGVSTEGSGQILPSSQNGFASLPKDIYHGYFNDDQPINVQAKNALPTGQSEHSIKQTEGVFGLMIHMSNALGVNCSFCHNSRSFASWDGQSRPNKMRAWYGIHMLRDLNQSYISPLADTFPANLKGPDGQPYKINCETCHQGVYKPLYGQPVIANYPELAVPDDGKADKPEPQWPPMADSTAPELKTSAVQPPTPQAASRG